MIRISLLCLIFCPHIVFSETVFVRSGEHPEYTRLAIDIEEGTSWDVQRTNSGYRIELGEPETLFNIENVFSRIPRNRLIDLVPNGSTLDLLVECRCYLDTYQFSPTMIVIDIRDELETPNLTLGVPDGASILLPRWRPLLQNNLAPNLNDLSTARRVELPLFFHETESFNDIPELALKAPKDYLDDTSRIEPESSIWEQFSSVDTQGLVDFSSRSLSTTMAREQGIAVVPTSLSAFPAQEVTTRLNELSPRTPGFLLHTAVDRDGNTNNGDEDEAACAGSMSLDITEWGDAPNYATLIAMQRLAVTDDAGNVRKDAIRSLARTYFYFGFGQEARLSLQLLPALEPQDSLLMILSRLVDGEPISLADLQRFRGCSPEIEMWLILAGETVDPSNEFVISATLNAYRALPETLRGHLGIQLARKFSDADQLNISEDILRGSHAAITGDERTAEIARSELQGHRNGSIAEAMQLDEFIKTSPRAEPEDLARLMDLARITKIELETSVYEFSEIMRFEASGSQSHATLLEAEVRLLIDRGLTFQALDLLNSEAEVIDLSLQAVLRSSAVTMLAQTASDEDFLSFAFTDFSHDIDNIAISSVVSRLIDMGFQDEALSLSGPTIERSTANEGNRYLQARDTLPDSFTQTDQTSDDGSLDPSFMTVQTEEEEGVVRAWQNGNWGILENSNDALLSRASRAILSPTAQLGQQTPLADTQSLLEGSASARVLVDDLLSRFRIQDIEISD